MKLMQHSTLPFALALYLFSAPASAGDGKHADKAAYVQCTCDSCAMYKADVAVLCEKLVMGAAPASTCEGTCDAEFAALKENPSHFYAQVFMTRQGDIDAALVAVKEGFTAPCATDAQRARLLDFAAHFPVRTNATLTAVMWQTAPQVFTTDHLLALASDAPKEIKVALKDRAATDVKVAAWFAYSGDTTHKALLEQAARQCVAASGSIRNAAVAGLGLKALGDERPLSKILAQAREASLALLDQGKLAEARTLALEAHYFGKLADKDKGYSSGLAWITTELDQMNRTKAQKLASAEEVFKLIESIQS